MKAHVDSNTMRGLIIRINNLKQYLRHEYGTQIEHSHECGTLCLNYALRGIGAAFTTTCDHEVCSNAWM
jgi:hypothetical protein